MKLHNLRFRFANNSSSSHSLVFVNDEELKNLTDKGADGSYGWQDFLLVSKKEKAKYFGIMLYNEIKNMIPDDACRTLFSKDLGISIPGEEEYIDHQSRYIIPMDLRTNFVNWIFVKDFLKYLSNKNIVIVGGNDNDGDEQLQVSGRIIQLPIPQDYSSSHFVARKDPRYKFWTLFNKQSGTKIRFVFDYQDIEATPKKSYAPELVDLKITNNCTNGCKYCYQNSNADGKHAEEYEVMNIIDELSRLEVFEIAIGGGDPLNHPRFVDILKYARMKGIVPNFSTRNIKWLDDCRLRNEILNNCGSFAYSADRYVDISRLGTIFDYFNVDRKKVSIQLTMGAVSQFNFQRILRKCFENHFCLTLLGFKNVGRGEDFKKKDYSWMIKEILLAKEEKYGKGYYLPSISMDTSLITEFFDEIQELKIPSWLYSTKEGSFSCYIDAVDKKIGPSSFCDEKDMVNFPSSKYNENYKVFEKEWFAEQYAKF